MNKEEQNHHSDQMNPNNEAYQDRMDNHANQLNPNNEEYEKNNN
ncbi:MAG: hypothetical protein ACOCRK_05595 [bacterium]